MQSVIAVFTLLKFAVWYWNTFLNKCGYLIHHFNAHFSLFAEDLLLATYFVFILYYGNDVIQKANLSYFLIWVTTCNISNTFGPVTANEPTVQWRFKKFCKGVESLEDEKCSGWPSEIDNDQLKAIFEADSLTTTQEVAKELNINHSMVIQHLKQIGKVKKPDKWAPHELTANQKKSSFLKASYLILCSNNEPFLDRVVTCDKKWILYHSWRWPAQWLDREESPKHFPKPNLHQKKSRSLFRGLLPVWSTIAFWIPAKPLIWDVCSANQWDALKTATPLASTGQ